MKKLNFLSLALLIALFVSIFLNMRHRINSDQIINNNTKTINKYESILSGIKMFRDFEVRSNGHKIHQDLTVINLDGVSMSLKSINYEYPLFFKFTESSCVSCTKQKFIQILDAIKSEPIDNLILLGEFESLRRIRLFSQMYELEHELYFLPTPLNLPIDDIDEPYFFELDDCLSATNVQIATTESLDLVKSYLRAVISKNH